MMEVVTGYPRDVVALSWHDELGANDVRANLTLKERDARAGIRDIRLLAKLVTLTNSEHSTRVASKVSNSAGQWRDIGRIAVVTDDRISRMAIQFFGPFFHNSIRVFPNAQSWRARAWLQGHNVGY
jgi:hypothetical protein